MAGVTIARQWGNDGDALKVTVHVAADYPDAMSEAQARALDTYRDALAYTLCVERVEDESGE